MTRPYNKRRNRCASLSSLLALLLLCFFTDAIEENGDDSLWEISNDIKAWGPTAFPKPNHWLGDDAVVALKPTFGTHRPSANAVFAYAEGYGLDAYLMFIETLRDTGFDGDIVLAIAPDSYIQSKVYDYLSKQANIVVYQVNLSCFAPDQITPAPRKIQRGGGLDIFQMCKLNGAYGLMEGDEDSSIKPVEDARVGRTVATLRYELYWIWSLNYNPQSWILLLDARDSYFQSNPFDGLTPFHKHDRGQLVFFGENVQATRLGQSRKNRNWLLNAYGDQVLDALKDKPTICSGSTMGHQIALETYLRAMVNEFDERGLKMTGADQGFHNYLYYSNKLANAGTIDSLVLMEQGKGAVNNVGAMRVKPLSEWGIYNETSHEVYNWDGSLSPVVHQYDRDKDLFYYVIKERFKELKKEWSEKKKVE